MGCQLFLYHIKVCSFTLIIIYKVLKLDLVGSDVSTGFTLIIIYKVLKQLFIIIDFIISFTLIIIYKVLKQLIEVEYLEVGFTLIIIYKVLKHCSSFVSFGLQFYSYHNLQGSQT